MNTAGFYKKDDNQILTAMSIVEGPNYLLVIEDKDKYTYPIDGWYYANSLDDFIAKLAAIQNQPTVISSGYTVQPENIVLGLQDSDRNAFTQLLVLINQAQQLSMIDDNTPQIISDINNIKHTISTLRFKQIMVEYGFYYKQIWDQALV